MSPRPNEFWNLIEAIIKQLPDKSAQAVHIGVKLPSPLRGRMALGHMV